MSAENKAALIGAAVYVGMRLFDWLFPGDRHFKVIDRWSKKNDTDTEEET